MVIIMTHLTMTFLLTSALILLSFSCITSGTTTNTAIQASSSSSGAAIELRENIIEKVEKVSELIQRAQKNAVEQEREARDGDGNAGSRSSSSSSRPSYSGMVEDYNNNDNGGGGSYSDATNPNPNPNPNPSDPESYPNPSMDQQYVSESDLEGGGMSDDYYRRAMNVSSSSGALSFTTDPVSGCPSSTLSDIGSTLRAVEAEVLGNRAADASNHAHLALFSLSDCLSTLSSGLPASASASASSSASVSMAGTSLTDASSSSQVLNSISLEESNAYILGQAISLLEGITLSLDKLDSLTSTSSRGSDEGSIGNVNTNMVEVESGKTKGGCKRDGTTCQFSNCGKGKNLPFCAMGFAYGVTGGARGPMYIVTRSDDNPIYPRPGSLRYAVRLGGGARGVWITFARSMIIVLKSMLWVRSSTTIDGRGYNITITGRMLVVGGVHNVILHNFQINSMALSDTIHVFAGSTKVWVDHITSFDAKLGLVSVVQRATDVTISNCKLSNRNFNMLLGAADSDISDKNLRVTVYRNWFKDSMQRMPHCRWGYCHVMNNLYTNWGYYAIGGRVHAKIRSEGNAFIAGRRAEVTPWFPGAGATPNFDGTALIQSLNDLLLNGSTFHQFNVVRHSAVTSSSSSSSAKSLSSSSVSVALAPPPPYRTPTAYPPSIPSPRALPELLRSCSGALFAPSSLRLCHLLSGLK